MIYFDNAATTYPKPQCVYDGVNYAMAHYSFNAGRGSYSVAKKTYKMIMDTREKLASIVDAESSNVIFTSSATESLNNIIYGLNLKEGDNVFISPFEHNAVARILHALKVNVIFIPFNKETWQLEEVKLKDMFVLKNPKAVIISHISNVTGFELPYEKIFKYSKQYKVVNVLDAAQSYAVYPINKKNIDFIVFAGHKSLYAMFGIAGYLKLGNIDLVPHKIGGTGSDSLNLEMPSELPSKLEAGSPNAVGIYSINCSLDYLKENDFKSKKEELVKYFLDQVRDNDRIIVYLPDGYVSKGIVSFNIEGYSSDDVGMILAEDYDICVRTGYHCAPYVHEFIGSRDYSGTVRISFSGFNSIEEVDKLVNVLEEL